MVWVRVESVSFRSSVFGANDGALVFSKFFESMCMSTLSFQVPFSEFGALSHS